MTVNELARNVTCFEFSRMGYMTGYINIKMELRDGKRTVRT